jgi:ketopantoate hydroxymethyltransferase
VHYSPYFRGKQNQTFESALEAVQDGAAAMLCECIPEKLVQIVTATKGVLNNTLVAAHNLCCPIE